MNFPTQANLVEEAQSFVNTSEALSEVTAGTKFSGFYLNHSTNATTQARFTRTIRISRACAFFRAKYISSLCTRVYERALFSFLFQQNRSNEKLTISMATLVAS